MSGKYYYVEGMMYPYWGAYDDERSPGEVNVHNLDADTDMGDLDGGEFKQMFPTAREIPQEVAYERRGPEWLLDNK